MQSSPRAPQETPAPTTKSAPLEEPRYSQTPPIIPSAEMQRALALETKHFRSPEGFFEIDYPAGWSVRQEESGVAFQSPSHIELLRVSVFDTGYPLDENSFIRFVEGRESNVFRIYQQYYEISRTIETQKAFFKKQFFTDGVKKAVLSAYYQSDQIVYTIDFWSDQETIEKSEEIFSNLLSTLMVNPEAAGVHDNTINNRTFLYETDHFSFQVPIPWKLTRTSSGFSVVDTFRSPDEMAVFQTVVYNDGKPIQKSAAGSFVLALLNKFYTKEVTVISDKTTGDQQEELVWESERSGIQGITLFHVRDNTLIIFTTLYKIDYERNYRTILEQILDSYQAIPITNTP